MLYLAGKIPIYGNYFSYPNFVTKFCWKILQSMWDALFSFHVYTQKSNKIRKLVIKLFEYHHCLLYIYFKIIVFKVSASINSNRPTLKLPYRIDKFEISFKMKFLLMFHNWGKDWQQNMSIEINIECYINVVQSSGFF